jgi:TRAP-type C4-dicarboxylate transport system substrate-binding protein
MITKKQVKTLDDMKGLKIRVAAGINGDLYRAVGIVPVFIASGEAFDALDKGTITASHGGLELIFRYKWNEAAKFYIDGYRSASNPQYNVVCNLDVWKGLPADVQKAIKDASAGWLEAYENILATNLQTYKKTFLAQGMVMSTLSNSDSDKWMGMMNISALKTQAAADAVKYGASDAAVKKIIQRYLDLETEYIKSYPNKF